MTQQINNGNVLSDEDLKLLEILGQNPLLAKEIIEAVTKCKDKLSTGGLQNLSPPYKIEDLAYKKATLPYIDEDTLKKIRFNKLISSSHQFEAVIV